MAIQFQFTLNDEDAENLMFLIQNAISQCHVGMLKAMGEKNGEAYVSWYKNHIKYIERMQETMLKNQKRVEDSKEIEI